MTSTKALVKWVTVRNQQFDIGNADLIKHQNRITLKYNRSVKSQRPLQPRQRQICDTDVLPLSYNLSKPNTPTAKKVAVYYTEQTSLSQNYHTKHNMPS